MHSAAVAVWCVASVAWCGVQRRLFFDYFKGVKVVGGTDLSQKPVAGFATHQDAVDHDTHIISPFFDDFSTVETACSGKLRDMDQALDGLRNKVSRTTPDVREVYKP